MSTDPMSPEVADLILRMWMALIDEGTGAQSYSSVMGPDEKPEDGALYLQAVGVVGQENIKFRDMHDAIQEIRDAMSARLTVRTTMLTIVGTGPDGGQHYGAVSVGYTEDTEVLEHARSLLREKFTQMYPGVEITREETLNYLLGGEG